MEVTLRRSGAAPNEIDVEAEAEGSDYTDELEFEFEEDDDADGALDAIGSSAGFLRDVNRMERSRRSSTTFLGSTPLGEAARKTSALSIYDITGTMRRGRPRAASTEVFTPSTMHRMPSSVGLSDPAAGSSAGSPGAARRRALGRSTLSALRKAMEEEEAERAAERLSPGGSVHSHRRRKHHKKVQHMSVAPMFRTAESFVLESSVREGRPEDINSHHKEVLDAEVGQTLVLPRAQTPSLPALLDRKELSASVRMKHPLRDWRDHAPEVPGTRDASLVYYSVPRASTWSMPARGTHDTGFRRAEALRPWDEETMNRARKGAPVPYTRRGAAALKALLEDSRAQRYEGPRALMRRSSTHVMVEPSWSPPR